MGIIRTGGPRARAVLEYADQPHLFQARLRHGPPNHRSIVLRGSGLPVARALAIDLPELGALGRRQISSLVGLAPFAKDSGKKSGYRRIRAGRAAPRTALYLAAMNVARFNPVLKPIYERMIAAGKPPKVAFIALARKLLTILNAMVRDGTDWQEATA